MAMFEGDIVLGTADQVARDSDVLAAELRGELQAVFLEISPAGEFLFSEHGSGYPITDAVAAWLTHPT